MDGFSKLLDALKIPLKVLLPAACLFSGLLSFLDDRILSKLGLISWKTENNFIIGLVFLISVSLIIVYSAFYLMKKLWKWINNVTLYPRTLKSLCKMNDMEIGIILELYNQHGYSGTLDWAHPIVKGLIARNYIYLGNNAYVSFDVFTESWPVKVTLQPFVYQTLNHYQPKLKKEIDKLSTKLHKATNAATKEKLQDELNVLKNNYQMFYRGRGGL